MRKLFVPTLALCLLFASSALADTVTLAGKDFSYNVPAGYGLADDKSDPELRELAKQLADDESMEFVLLENKSANMQTSLGLPLFVMIGLNEEMVEFTQMEYDFLVAIMSMALSMGGDMGEGFAPGDVVEGRAAKLGDMVILFDEAKPTVFSFSFQSKENDVVTDEVGLMTFLYNGSVVSVIQAGNAKTVEEYNEFIHKAVTNLETLAVSLI